MFNPLTPAQTVTAIGRTARTAARTETALDEWGRGQLKSAFSASRHLAIELESFPDELRSCCEHVSAAASAAVQASSPCPQREALASLAARVERAGDAPAAGAALAELLELCRGHRHAPWPELRREVQSALRTLCEREVALLAAGIERR
jgi:hypothetical protein